MAKYDLVSADYSALSGTEKYAYLVDFKAILQAAFGENSNDQRLFAHMALLSMYKNSVQKAILSGLQRDIDEYITKVFGVLESYMLKATKLTDEDIELATKLSYIVFEYKTGEDLPDFCEELYDEHFAELEPTEDEWMLLDWLSGLVLQIAVIEGHELDEDIEELFDDKTNIDLIYFIEDLLESMAVCYLDKHQIKSLNDVYSTAEHIAVVEKVRAAITDALKQSRPFDDAYAKYQDATLIPEDDAAIFFVS